jgi:uncharacterized OsmC-like protein
MNPAKTLIMMMAAEVTTRALRPSPTTMARMAVASCSARVNNYVLRCGSGNPARSW